jgi:hypothetical protein
VIVESDMTTIGGTPLGRAPSQLGRLDLERYVPGLVTFIANKLARSATTLYQKRFSVSVTEWRILSQLAIDLGMRIPMMMRTFSNMIVRTIPA